MEAAMKRLVLCCDGTWGRADQAFVGQPCPTNVVRLGYRVAKRDARGVPQIVYYDQGVGTGNVLDRYTGALFGLGLDVHLFEAYRFLVANYEPGDEIYIFGFSRGAFTARSIAGMIRKCGILRRESVQDYTQAISLYRSAEHPNAEGPCHFRTRTSVMGVGPIPVRCVGVWDTVGALGIPLRGWERLTAARYQFHDTELSGSIEHGYHALAIDERREPFEPTVWAWKPKPGQTVEQVWFPGTHSDLGGGFPKRGLADLTLQWMIEKAQGAGLGFDAAAMAAHPLAPNPLERINVIESALHRFVLGRHRPVGLSGYGSQATPDPTQTLHASVRQRWDGDAEYRPLGLRNYFQRIGDRRSAKHQAVGGLPA